MDIIDNAIDQFIRQHKECTERILEEIITKYDFIVGSEKCKHMLMEVLPEGANIIYLPYIESTSTIYAIKKFDIIEDALPYLKFVPVADIVDEVFLSDA